MNIFSSKLLCRIEDEQFIQPVYNGSNISSTLFDSSKFAVIASSTYSNSYSPFYLFNEKYASGGDDTGVKKIWESGSGSKNVNPYIKFSNPIPINIKNICFDFRIERAGRVPKGVTIYGSNKDSGWTLVKSKTTFTQERTLQTVNITSNDYYKGYYLYFDGSGGTGEYSVTEIANLIITATYEVNE